MKIDNITWGIVQDDVDADHEALETDAFEKKFFQSYGISWDGRSWKGSLWKMVLKEKSNKSVAERRSLDSDKNDKKTSGKGNA